jgi:DNA-binding CsgD family transcriptional regulator/tetratricopeptide (TPR) repeat protein
VSRLEVAGEVELGRTAFAQRAWSDAYERLSHADAAALSTDDLVSLATSAYMVGRMDVFFEVTERAHHAYLDQGDPLGATRCAVYLGINLAIRGDIAHASGWFGRGQRLVERHGDDCAERGYLLLPYAMQQLEMGQYDEAEASAAAAVECGERFRDSDLLALALHVHGQTLIKQSRIHEGLARLDEAMLGVTGDDVSPIISGVVYCGVIAGCEDAYDIRRAREWTEALTQWCERQPEMVSFTGRCLAHRAGIMQLRGAWPEALEEARRARERCEEAMNELAAGQALYYQGELHRLQGDFAAAGAAYQDANRYGHEPQPGLSLLRLDEGDHEAAASMIRRALGEAAEPLLRTRLLPADAEIAIAVGDVAEARRAADELSAIAGSLDILMLRALAANVQGMVALAEEDPSSALVSLRAARATWQELDAPYETARTCVLIGRACRALGDEGTAVMELETATSVFEQLGALPDLARLEALVQPEPTHEHGLTQRERQVLRLVAAGKTNRDIASELVISEHTVARHVQNIFQKLGVSSRTAATAFAFEHHLV